MAKEMVAWPLPVLGISRIVSVEKESPGYSGYLNNVRPTDVQENRIRLGQRPGLSNWSTDQIGGAELPVVAMTVVSSVA